MNNRTVITPKTSQGFSLVELMVGLVVGMITVLAILQSLSLFEGQKRTTVSGADAQESGLMAMYMLERDARMTGNGMLFSDVNTSALACTRINRWVPGSGTAPGSADTGGGFLPISITDGGTGGGSPASALPDAVVLRYGTGGSGSASGRLKTPVADSNPATPLVMYSATGFQVGDDILIARPGTALPCSRLRITAIDNTTDSLVAQVYHASGTGTNELQNPPATNNIFPAGGYTDDARIFSMGGMAENCYFVESNTLMQSIGSTCPPPASQQRSPVADNIVTLQAQYGITAAGGGAVTTWVDATGIWATDSTASPPTIPLPDNLRRIRAVRIAVVARSALPERDTVSPAAWSVLNGTVTGSLTNDQRRFRYKTYETLVPSRNLVWVNPQ